MAETSETPGADRFTVKVTSDSHFSWIRTRLSLERTLMSWVRTAISLIGFGFTIVQFFEHLKGFAGAVPPRFPEAPRYFGMALIFCGIAALIVSAWDYKWSIRYLWSERFKPLAGASPDGLWTPLFSITLLLILIGALTFSALLLRIA